ncbi:hypothetical protein M513_00144 [Trichuris suis]|uniref:Retrotransposon gag domain-containing protein n=1 Tax=Trichuris suis TaxID=68888 RepID=A0A085MP35_9BILA|nr:hypothetical protein M513_00144 [Trichuris suis]
MKFENAVTKSFIFNYELSYEKITVAMRQYFNPAPSEIVERFRFYKRDQRPNESIADFVAELRRLSEHCNFGNGLDTALRDRFVCGIADEGLQRRLLAEQVPTFDVALREALATETARLQALEIRTGGCTEDVQHVRMKSRQQKSTDKATGSRQRTEFSAKCYRCGGAHDAQACRFINERCRVPNRWKESSKQKKDPRPCSVACCYRAARNTLFQDMRRHVFAEHSDIECEKPSSG